METKAWTYEEFPEYTEHVDGATMVDTTGDEIEVKYLNDVPYETEGGVELHLQLLVPVTRNGLDGPLPCIAFVKGSAWRKQKMYVLIPELARIAQMGYVVAEVEYRPASDAPFPAQIVDTQNAIRYLRANADKLGIDPEKIIVMGNSSGGHCAVFASFLEAGGSAIPDVPCGVRGVIDLYGAVSLLADDSFPITSDHHTPTSPEGILMGGADMRDDMKLREKGTAACYITPELEIPPVLIVHGMKDRKCNTQQSVDLYRKLLACGKDAELYLVRGADHGGAEFYTDYMLGVYDGFIRRCLK